MLPDPLTLRSLQLLLLVLWIVLGDARLPAARPLEDCNRNGVEDLVDITFGTSSDLDRDGVPDECQRVEGTAGEGHGPGTLAGSGHRE